MVLLKEQLILWLLFVWSQAFCHSLAQASTPGVQAMSSVTSGSILNSLGAISYRQLLSQMQVSPVTNVSQACTHQCSPLQGQAADRCAFWHQVVMGFGHVQEPFNLQCDEFVRTIDICGGGLAEGRGPVNVTCGEEGRVVELRKSTSWEALGSQKYGHLSSALAVLEQLRLLNFSSMSLGGTLPGEWRGLKKVLVLDLSQNRLTGPLPPEWGQMVELTELSLFHNSLTGTLPPGWGGLVGLRGLYLYNNSLTGTLPPEWGQMVGLIELSLFHNRLTGTLPPGWGGLVGLRGLYLYNNSLTGTLPPAWGQMVELTELSLTDNHLAGTLTPELGQLVGLAGLYLSNNSLTGTLPPEWGQMVELTELSLSDNCLTGTLPPGWGQIVGLTGLYLYNNSLTGTLPLEWEGMVALTELILYNNSLTGTLPPEWGRLMGLRGLYLFDNRLTGTLPPEWGQLVGLTELSLFNNSLAGPLPPEWGQMVRLNDLLLYDNDLTGTLPPEWGQMVGLNQLSAFNNRLTGPLPEEWAGMEEMAFLWLQGNDLSSTIPSNWGDLRKLTYLDLSGNKQMGGRIPKNLLHLPRLQSTFWTDFFNITEEELLALDYQELFVNPDMFNQLVPLPLRPLFGPGTNTKVISAQGTGIRLPSYLAMHGACQRCQRAQGTLYITYGGDGEFWCGRTQRADLQVALLWSCFGLTLISMTVGRWYWYWRRRKHQQGGLPSTLEGNASTTTHNHHMRVSKATADQRWWRGVLDIWQRHLRVPLKAALGIFDIVSDVLLAVSMYPSWTFYVVMVGFFLPDLICSAALAVQSVRHMRVYVPTPMSYLLAGILFIILSATLPLLLVIFVAVRVVAGQCLNSPAAVLNHVDVDRVLDLFSALTACTEDIFTSVFSSVGLILMNRNPLATVTTHIYFPVWAFWLSVPASMLHMALCWWSGTGQCLQHGDLSWVVDGFRRLVVGRGHQSGGGSQTPGGVEMRMTAGDTGGGGDGGNYHRTAPSPSDRRQVGVAKSEDEEEVEFRRYLDIADDCDQFSPT